MYRADGVCSSRQEDYCKFSAVLLLKSPGWLHINYRVKCKSLSWQEAFQHQGLPTSPLSCLLTLLQTIMSKFPNPPALEGVLTDVNPAEMQAPVLLTLTVTSSRFCLMYYYMNLPY